tara:strand:+ start:878 stop:1381 length:504 start_codon:yes stop_codon:yes gene_type:complete
MARRPNKDDIFRSIKAYKLEYGYDSGTTPSNMEVEDNHYTQTFSENVGSTVMSEIADGLFNGEAFEPPNTTGNVPMSEALFNLASWFELKTVKRTLAEVAASFRPYFRKLVLPRTANALYVTFYFEFRKEVNPELKDYIFSISLSVKGRRDGFWKLIAPGGKLNDGV